MTQISSKIFLVACCLIGLSYAQELGCTSNNIANVYSFTINASSPLGTINLMYAQFDSTRRLPLSTTALHNSLNQNRDFPRIDNFRQYPCDHILAAQTACHNTFRTTPEQAEYSGRSTFDRGHVMPVNPFRFSHEAQDRTFYCVNNAPQDPFTNQNPWATVENTVFEYFASKPAYVMTGICDFDNRISPTNEGYGVPDCYWKLACYKDDFGMTQVVGWVGDNTLLNWNDTLGRTNRTAETTMPRSQQDVLNHMARDYFVQEAWSGAQTFLLRNRNETGAPPAAECRTRLFLNQAVKREWTQMVKEQLRRHEFTEEVDLDAVLAALQLNTVSK